MNKVTAIVVAAGEGQRFGAPKQFAPLGDKPVLEWSLGCFDSHVQVADIVLVLANDLEKEAYIRRFPKITAVVNGGKHRQDSVMAGLKSALEDDDAFVAERAKKALQTQRGGQR